MWQELDIPVKTNELYKNKKNLQINKVGFFVLFFKL